MPSSAVTTPPSVNTGTIWSVNAPASCAAAARSCDCAEYSSRRVRGQIPLLRDHLRGDALVERETVIAGKRFRPVRHAGGARGAQRHPAHHLDAAGHHDVLLAGHHGLHGEVQRLLARSARAVDRGAGDVLGPARGQHRVAADVARLVADLGHAAPHHVVDDVGVHAGALGEFVEHHGRQVGGVLVGQSAVALADRRAHGSDDDGFPHYLCSDLISRVARFCPRAGTAHRPLNSASRFAANAA